MTSWLQLWRNTFFWIFDIEHLRMGKRYGHKSMTAAIYSTKAIIWRLISIMARIFFPEDIKKSRTPLDASCWPQFRSLFGIKISLLVFEISTKMCEPKLIFGMPSRRQLWRHDCNYDVMHFFKIFDIEHLRKGKRYRHNSLTVAIYSTKAISSGILFQ